MTARFTGPPITTWAELDAAIDRAADYRSTIATDKIRSIGDDLPAPVRSRVGALARSMSGFSERASAYDVVYADAIKQAAKHAIFHKRGRGSEVRSGMSAFPPPVLLNVRATVAAYLGNKNAPEPTRDDTAPGGWALVYPRAFSADAAFAQRYNFAYRPDTVPAYPTDWYAVDGQMQRGMLWLYAPHVLDGLAAFLRPAYDAARHPSQPRTASGVVQLAGSAYALASIVWPFTGLRERIERDGVTVFAVEERVTSAVAPFMREHADELAREVNPTLTPDQAARIIVRAFNLGAELDTRWSRVEAVPASNGLITGAKIRRGNRADTIEVIPVALLASPLSPVKIREQYVADVLVLHIYQHTSDYRDTHKADPLYVDPSGSSQVSFAYQVPGQSITLPTLKRTRSGSASKASVAAVKRAGYDVAPLL